MICIKSSSPHHHLPSSSSSGLSWYVLVMAKAAVEGSVSQQQSYSITRLHSTAPISRRRLEEARHQLSIATGTISLLAHTLLGSCSYISINTTSTSTSTTTTSKSTSTTTATTYSCGLPVCRRSLIDCITSTVIFYQLSSLNSASTSAGHRLCCDAVVVRVFTTVQRTTRDNTGGSIR